MRTLLKARLTLKLVLLAVSLTTLTAHPAAAQSMGLVPAEVDQNFEPGKPFQMYLSVSNGENTPIQAKVGVTDFWYDAKFQKTFGNPGSSPHSAANWIEAVPRQIEIPAHGTGKIEIIVTPPAEAAGGYYAAVFVESKPQLVEAASAQNNNKAVFANLRLGSLILLNAKGAGVFRADFSHFNLEPGGAQHDLQVTLDASNTGNTHIFPQPRLAILDQQHKMIARAQGESRRLLPGESQPLKVTWSGTLDPGDYIALLTVSYGPDKVFTKEMPFTVPGNSVK